MRKDIVRKYLSYIALIPLLFLALTPPWMVRLDCTLNSFFWIYMVFTSGFLMLLFFYFKVNLCVKLFLLWAYIGCFLSAAPYLCFTMFWSLIAAAYYYLLCKQITDFEPVKKAIQTLFFFVTLLIITQSLGYDTLLNFNLKDPIILGTIGNTQILASYVCVIAPFLIFTPLNWIALILIMFVAKSAGGMIAILIGLGYYLWRKYRWGKYVAIILLMAALLFTWKLGKFDVFTTSGRFPVWKKTIELTVKKPVGYGMATSRLIFPVLCGDIEPTHGASMEKWEYENTVGQGLAWRRTHNDFLQIMFEYGFPGFFLFAGWVMYLVWKARKNIMKSTGLVILGMIMLPHFPSRMCQAVLILLMFVAFCEAKEVAHERH